MLYIVFNKIKVLFSWLLSRKRFVFMYAFNDCDVGNPIYDTVNQLSLIRIFGAQRGTKNFTGSPKMNGILEVYGKSNIRINSNYVSASHLKLTTFLKYFQKCNISASIIILIKYKINININFNIFFRKIRSVQKYDYLCYLQ